MDRTRLKRIVLLGSLVGAAGLAIYLLTRKQEQGRYTLLDPVTGKPLNTGIDTAAILESLREWTYSPPPPGVNPARVTVPSWWVDKWVTTVTLSNGQRIQFHRGAANALKEALDEALALGATVKFDGSFVPRRSRWESTGEVGYHSMALAIDLNASKAFAARGKGGTQDPRIVNAMRRRGFKWGALKKNGGDWPGTFDDPMHFEVPLNIRVPEATPGVPATASIIVDGRRIA